jgi:mevalonate pyrophosphate decarboxylase
MEYDPSTASYLAGIKALSAMSALAAACFWMRAALGYHQTRDPELRLSRFARHGSSAATATAFATFLYMGATVLADFLL